MISPLMIDLKGFDPIEQGRFSNLYIYYLRIRGEDPGSFVLRGWMALIAIEQPRIQDILILYHI